MDFEQELKKFELSSVFTINFSWLKQYVESRNGIYTPIRNISDDDFREIESSFYALQVAWKAWREAKDQAVPEGFALIKDDTKTVVAIERMVEQQVEASGMDSRRLERLDGWKIIEAAVKAQEQAND
ncbi:MAG: hypothetical protein RR605_01865 [Acinetobacter sp.]